METELTQELVTSTRDANVQKLETIRHLLQKESERLAARLEEAKAALLSCTRRKSVLPLPLPSASTTAPTMTMTTGAARGLEEDEAFALDKMFSRRGAEEEDEEEEDDDDEHFSPTKISEENSYLPIMYQNDEEGEEEEEEEESLKGNDETAQGPPLYVPYIHPHHRQLLERKHQQNHRSLSQSPSPAMTSSPKKSSLTFFRCHSGQEQVMDTT